MLKPHWDTTIIDLQNKQLLLVSGSREMGDVRINSGERSFLNTLKKHPDVQFPLAKIVKPEDKIFIVIQVKKKRHQLGTLYLILIE
jgi:hypothetical protein